MTRTTGQGRRRRCGGGGEGRALECVHALPFSGGGFEPTFVKSLQPGSCVAGLQPCYARDWRRRAEPFSLHSIVFDSAQKAAKKSNQ